MRSALTTGSPWYVQTALSVRRGHAWLVCLCGLLAAGVVGCGGGERQDANEDDASYDVEVVKADFPKRQRLAQSSELEITVRNADTETVPNVAVTLNGFYRAVEDPDLADPNRPVFVLDGEPAEFGGYPDVKLAGPAGGATSLVSTWALGPLKPGRERTFRWRVTPVKAGPFEIAYAVAAGLQGKAKAAGAGGAQPRGEIAGTITSRPPASRIAADGVTVVNPVP
jgi:hypothetical protein